MKALDLASKQFGKLTVIERHPENTNQGKSQWICECSCPPRNRVVVSSGNLTSGHTKSCGCLITEHCQTVLLSSHSTHGLSKTAEYNIWAGMKGRCHDPENKDYPAYGAKGITVCDRWQEFEAFYEDMGPRPTSRHSIDRRENDKGYYPENCRWATKVEQANNRSSNVYYEVDGERLTLTELARKHGLLPATLKKRLKFMSMEKALRPVIRPLFKYNGQEKSLADWVKELGLNYGRTILRLQRGWDFEKAIADQLKPREG